MAFRRSCWLIFPKNGSGPFAPEQMEAAAAKLGMASADIRTFVAVEAPECPVSLAYQAWLVDHSSTGAAGFCIRARSDWERDFGPGSVLQWIREFCVNRKPPLHIVRIFGKN